MLARRAPIPSTAYLFRRHASTAPSTHHKIVIVGGGTAGLTVAAQLQRAFKSEKRPLRDGEIAIVDPAKVHHCESRLGELGEGKEELTVRWRADQPGWTLVCVGIALESSELTLSS